MEWGKELTQAEKAIAGSQPCCKLIERLAPQSAELFVARAVGFLQIATGYYDNRAQEPWQEMLMELDELCVTPDEVVINSVGLIAQMIKGVKETEQQEGRKKIGHLSLLLTKALEDAWAVRVGKVTVAQTKEYQDKYRFTPGVMRSEGRTFGGGRIY